MPRKSAPFSIRLTDDLNRMVSEEARRTNRSKGAVIESLAEEGMRARRYPGIAFRGEDWARRAWVIGTALDVWQVIEAYRDFGSVERVVNETDLGESQLRLALAYYERHPNEIDEAIRENRRSIEDLLEAYPTAAVHRVAG